MFWSNYFTPSVRIVGGVAPLLVTRNVVHFRDKISTLRTKVRLRVSVTVKTPTHAQRLHLPHHIHLINPTVARRATDTSSHVNAMVKIGIIREHVDLDPGYRLVLFVTFPNESEFLAVCFYVFMTVHARCCGRNGSMCSFLYRIVAVTAVHPKVASVQFMTEGHRLFGSVANVCELWRKVVRDPSRCREAP